MDERIFIDVTSVLGLKEEEQRVDELLFDILSKFSDDWKKGQSDGALVVLGNFFSGVINNMDFINSDNHITDEDKIWITDADIVDQFKRLTTEPMDGAIVVHLNGKVIAAGVNLILNDLKLLKQARELNCPGGGMRHIAGIYTSMREDVLSVFIVSGETGRLTLWKKGEKFKQYDPSAKDDKELNPKKKVAQK